MIKKFSILIPVFNERKNIEILVDKISKFLKKNIFEIIVIDDNSHDGTKEILKRIKSKNNKFNYLIRNKPYRDLSKSVILGISKAQYKNIVVMDGDLQHDPKYLPSICKIFSNKKLDFLVCSRDFENRQGLSLIRYYSSKFLILFVNLVLNKKVSDPMSGFFIFKKKFYVLNKRKIYKSGFKILLNLLYSTKKKLKIYEKKIIFKKRSKNKSKMNLKVLFHIIVSIFYYFSLNIIK